MAAALGINKTGSGDFIQLQKSGSDIFRVANSGNVIFGGSDNHSITVRCSALTGNAGSQLLLQAGGGGSGDGSAGGDLILRGGDARW